MIVTQYKLPGGLTVDLCTWCAEDFSWLLREAVAGPFESRCGRSFVAGEADPKGRECPYDLARIEEGRIYRCVAEYEERCEAFLQEMGLDRATIARQREETLIAHGFIHPLHAKK